MKTSYFTFGQSHIHSINEVLFDKDCIVQITAEDPRNVMFLNFGAKWAMQYDDVSSILSYYPRGIIVLQ